MEIRVRTFGEFSVTAGDTTISATARSRKLWSLLACLLCHRGSQFSSRKLMELLWAEDTESGNPENALRVTLTRLRQQLDQLWPGAGKELICRQGSSYYWNPDIALWTDFDELEKAAGFRGTEEERLEVLLSALSLYKGEFLPRMSSDGWAIPVAAHFQNLYIRLTLEGAELLNRRQRYAEAAALCRRAVAMEPYQEPLHQMLMRSLGAAGDARGAAAVYETLSKRLFDDFGIYPGEQTRAVYREAAHTPEDRSIPIDEIMEHLREQNTHSGALVVDYDYFKVLCFAESRAMERTGNAAHVALFSLSPGEKELSKESRERIMDQLGGQLRTNLRRGDVVSRCSVSQYIILLPKANYENSCMVCRRILAAFRRAHPGVHAGINHMVQPLSPRICVP